MQTIELDKLDTVGLEEAVALQLLPSEAEVLEQADRIESRIRRVVNLYFAERKTIRQIADIVQASKSQVGLDITAYKQKFARQLKRDLSVYRHTASALIGLVTQCEYRIRILIDKNEQLERYIQVFSVGINRAHKRITANPNARIYNRAIIKDEARESVEFINAQRAVLSELRRETEQLLSIYNAFGLCRPDDLNTALQVKDAGSFIEELKSYLHQVIDVVKDEVTDKREQSRVFARLASLSGRLDKVRPIEEELN